MIREFLSHLHWTTLPIITMLMFMGVFFGALLWVYRRQSTAVYREASHLPLLDEAHGHEVKS